VSTPKNPLEKLLEAFHGDLRTAINAADEKRRLADLQDARVEQLRRAIDRIEEHIENGKKAETARLALEQQRALQGVVGGGMQNAEGFRQGGLR
jgi:thioesterase domain-containing protein